jgi:hypothetical protein
MPFYKLPQRPIGQVAPFPVIDEFSAFSAGRPRSHGKSAHEDWISFGGKIGAPVHLEDWGCATEVAVIPATWHDAWPERHKPA